MKIYIESSFQRGGCLLRWDSYHFSTIAVARECTYAGDVDDSVTMDVLDTFRGAVVRFWGISAYNTCNTVELIGFSEAELGSPSPVKGWARCQGNVCRSTDDWQIKTFGDYLQALARGADICTLKSAVSIGEKHPSGNGMD